MSRSRPKRKRKNGKSSSAPEQPHRRAAQTHSVCRNVSRQYMGTMLSFLYRPFRLVERTGTVLGSLCPRFLRRPFTLFAAAVFGVIGLLALRFKRPRDRGRRGDPEISDNDRDSEKKAPEEAEEESCVVPIGGPAVTGGRAADSRALGPATESRNRPRTAEEASEESRVEHIRGLAVTGGRAADSRAPGPAAESRKRPKTAEEDGEEPRVEHTGDSVVTGGRAADSCAPGPAAESCKRPRTTEEEDDEEFDGREYRVENTDELYCEYDSTWESSPTSKALWVDRPRVFSYHKFGRFKNAARDMQNYRCDYPQLKSRRQRWNQAHDMPNLDFYLGHRPSSPDSISIHEFHSSEWYGNYDKLERVHTFIQWLFPLQEPGVNYQASELTKEEIEAFLASEQAKENLLKSYKLMLDFYGIELYNVETGEVRRASNWREQFYNLNNNTHNNLRITRILKCLGTLGFAHYQAPLVRFFLKETLVHGELPNVKESVLNYFVFAVLNKTKRRNLIKFAYMNYDRKDEFVWCPKQIQRDESSEDGKPNQKQNLRPTSGSSLGYSSPGPENQMSDDSSHGGAAKPELSLSPTGGGGDHTADNPNSDEEPTEVCHDQINANEVSSAKEIGEEGQSSKEGGSDDESSTDAESDQRL
ncbi:opioid growth factor receptor-like protein 1 isoform X2 [Centroberyx affinis]|uniref:opioid growth factor receptor-like protein 1 isoform X2 n=1 Tax=Centroberyx affinis TaxID=166261 RepID=UPI003A5BC7FA